MKKEVKDGLKNVDNMTEVVVQNKVVVSVPAGKEEDGELICN